MFAILAGACDVATSFSSDRHVSAPSPKTDIKDGREATSDCELVVIGIVGI